MQELETICILLVLHRRNIFLKSSPNWNHSTVRSQFPWELCWVELNLSILRRLWGVVKSNKSWNSYSSLLTPFFLFKKQQQQPKEKNHIRVNDEQFCQDNVIFFLEFWEHRWKAMERYGKQRKTKAHKKILHLSDCDLWFLIFPYLEEKSRLQLERFTDLYIKSSVLKF